MVIKSRSDVLVSDTWDLTGLFESDEKFEIELNSLKSEIKVLGSYSAEIATDLCKLLQFTKLYFEFSERIERVSSYAFLKNTEDVSVGTYQSFNSQSMNLSIEFNSLTSFFKPALIKISEADCQKILLNKDFDDYKIFYQKVWRNKDHTLTDAEEKILSQVSQIGYGSNKIFSVLTNAEFEFGEIEVENKVVPITNASYAVLLADSDREVRKNTYLKFMGKFNEFKNTLAEIYSNKLQYNVMVNRLRKYPSCREASLFHDSVPVQVYDNLIEQVRNAVPAVSKYIELRKQLLGLEKVHTYDLRVSLCEEAKRIVPYEEGVALSLKSLEILGSEYCDVLSKGLNGRWVDKYENKGKRSGAFSAGSYNGDPYVLLNYREDHFDSVFTLIHEAGHSMHSHYSVKNNPYAHYNYTIFVAEVASTFNEELLFQYLLKNEKDEMLKASLINKKIDDIYGTVFRQTMFAEFEKIVHENVEAGKPMTTDDYRGVFGQLQKDYYSDSLTLHELNDLECFRIPHFYNPFYVYKYATGLSASIALADQVRAGGKTELNRYLSFLKNGGAQPPLDQLRDAGVDMTKPEAVGSVLNQFSTLVDQLENLLLNK